MPSRHEDATFHPIVVCNCIELVYIQITFENFTRSVPQTKKVNLQQTPSTWLIDCFLEIVITRRLIKVSDESIVFSWLLRQEGSESRSRRVVRSTFFFFSFFCSGSHSRNECLAFTFAEIFKRVTNIDTHAFELILSISNLSKKVILLNHYSYQIGAFPQYLSAFYGFGDALFVCSKSRSSPTHFAQ